MKIRFFYDDVSFRFRRTAPLKELISEVIRAEKKVAGDLMFILTGDKRIIEINREFLNHDYFTDVITFGYNNREVVNGEIYISIDTVKANAINYNVSFKHELTRVVIHSVLHLCGYDDKTDEERKEMRRMEDYWLLMA